MEKFFATLVVVVVTLGWLYAMFETARYALSEDSPLPGFLVLLFGAIMWGIVIIATIGWAFSVVFGGVK